MTIDHYSNAIESQIAYRADAAQHIDLAIEADPNHAMSKITKAWMLHAGRDANAADSITQLIDDANSCIQPGDTRESGLISALGLARSGNSGESITLLENMVLDAPTDLLLHQIAQEEIFWTGDAKRMRNVTEQSAFAWQETTEGYGYYLAFRSFANEEAGYFDDAERFGRMAIEINRSDIWAAHAVAHVLIMRGEIDKGISWLEQLQSNWQHANQMRHHLWWHMCLFLIELGRNDQVLELLTTQIRNPASDLVRASPAAPIDIQNFSSLLLRLELCGVSVGDQWQTLAKICADRTSNLGNAFGSIHDVMVLGATGQFDKANTLLQNMQDLYQHQTDDVSVVHNQVGYPVCQAMIAYFKKDFDSVLSLLGDVRHKLQMIGASHAQRDIFYQLLIYSAEQAGRGELRSDYLREIEQLGFENPQQRAAYRN